MQARVPQFMIEKSLLLRTQAFNMKDGSLPPSKVNKLWKKVTLRGQQPSLSNENPGLVVYHGWINSSSFLSNVDSLEVISKH